MATKVQQVFVGCAFKPPIRNNYDKLKRDIEQESPIHIVLADTTSITSTDYLLEHITNLIRDSAGCVFDVTGGNPNVSLEVGIAHALPSDFLLMLYTRRRAANIEEGEARPIISDLQGRNRIEYKSYPTLKHHLTSRYLNRLPYWKRWTDFKRNHSSYVPPAIEVFDEIRASGRTVRPRVTSILDGTGIRADDLLTALTQAKLITVKRGRAGGIFYPAR